ncbi:MAG: MgtC/SapB family protein [Simplicispira sp.]|jgi:putative Mg2+ transporter-C (MgtC) family protein|nr:MgtC/SapB family protein [Simplicispira sp.]
MDSAWNQIGGTVAAEFSDLTDLSDATRIVVRLLVAGVLGGILGWEREHAGKAAGVRTHMLVAMGAALFVLVSQQIGIEAPDMSRVVQGIVAGVGFLGAGTILKGSGEEKVHGLTTAAGIWLTAAIGTAAGLCLETTAGLSAVLAFALLGALPLLQRVLTRGTGAPPDRSQ